MRGWSRVLQVCEDRFENGCRSREYVTVPETQRAIALLGKPSVADDVSLALSVLAPVELDNQVAFGTDEVGDVSADRHLASELERL